MSEWSEGQLEDRLELEYRLGRVSAAMELAGKYRDSAAAAWSQEKDKEALAERAKAKFLEAFARSERKLMAKLTEKYKKNYPNAKEV